MSLSVHVSPVMRRTP